LEQAVEFAKIGLRAHHALFHRARAKAAAPTCEATTTCGNPTSNCEELHLCHAAFARAKAMFDELCGLYGHMRDGDASSGEFSRSSGTFLQACRELDHASRAYHEALAAYGEALAERAEEIHRSKTAKIA
jgi:hypothetical protein